MRRALVRVASDTAGQGQPSAGPGRKSASRPANNGLEQSRRHGPALSGHGMRQPSNEPPVLAGRAVQTNRVRTRKISKYVEG